ncbi:putative G-protein coupled receptor 156 isoform X2 [Genypterus blacodes]|uniref:putative G-protein coupled receptor 156 isoform X2 n=1 Tax=Genypterus blacodes TaxID=154954 RepID=UPI003F75B962
MCWDPPRTLETEDECVTVDRPGPIMEPELNCSSHCDSPLCFIHSGVNRQEGLDILQRLCTLSTMAVELPKRSLSPVLTAVVWTLLSSGILLAFCFLFFTLRFKNNRIVKMSSPNLNVLTLFGSVLTYGSCFLFAIDERTHSHVGASRAVLQARMWTLCVGSTLVFGPILGKTWRLYRVFTQRVPDKRVIIRDIQLMAMVALLVLVDLLVLTAWNLTDPIRCSHSLGAIVKVVEKDVSYSLSQLDSCSSVYSDLWIVLIAVQKGCLLLYGTYLAGLTSNVSHPPVNQSPTIITAVTLVTLSSIVAAPVSIFLQAWPNLVYSTVAGAIFICTLATNCMLFVPQLTQWRQFEDEHNNPSQMAKYFSSPSKSQPSVYSQDEVYYLLGENSSMKKLLSEKNAVIDSLQEQVNNAKDKLLRLMSVSQTHKDQQIDSSANLNSSSTQTTLLQFEGLSSSLPQRAVASLLPCSRLSPHPTDAVSSAVIPKSSDAPSAATSTTPSAVCSALSADLSVGLTQRSSSVADTPGSEVAGSRKEEDLKQARGEGTPQLPSIYVTSSHSPRSLNPAVEISGHHSGSVTSQQESVRLNGIISSEQLQEILQELSVDAASETSLRCPSLDKTLRISSQSNFTKNLPLSPPHSPHPSLLLSYPSISPYSMRKRRPPFHSSRRGIPPPCFSPGLETAGWGKQRDNRVLGHARKPTCKASPHPEEVTADGARLQSDNRDLEVEEEVAQGHRAIRKCRKCVSRSPCEEHAHLEAGGGEGQLSRHVRHSCGSWESDSSSSSDYCYYHRPYCDSCLQRGSLLSSDSSSDSSDSEYGGYTGLYRSQHPVVFKDDLKPTFV